ncbi:4535_t:CDS:2 [Ambispora leptoticha]|uniref:4535_t:CDS:1 n=1 Tax=Ambispora leptoticha TaxID=144679 RepID=A0A9N9FKK0_9GLOM|nr:4535_t:CDS:2 [Ambispora leptoticha]
MKNKGSSDRQLIVETAYYGKKDSQQSDLLRPAKSTETTQKPKKKKRSPNITEGMSLAEIFAANVASAVDAEAELDEDEDFIYGDIGHTSSITNLNSDDGGGVGSSGTISNNGINQPSPPPTFTYSYMPPDPHKNYGYPPNHYSTHYQFPGLYMAASMPNSSQTIDGGNNNKKGSSPNNLLSPSHKPTGVMRASLPDMSRYSNYGATGYYYNDPFYHDWYGVEDGERLPLFARWRPPYEDQRRTCCTSAIFSLTTFLVFSIVAFCYLIYFASSQPLTEVAIIDIANILMTDKEIIFDMYVKGRNLDIWDVKIMDADLQVFAMPYQIGGFPEQRPEDGDDDDNHINKDSSISTITSTLDNDIKGPIENSTNSKNSSKRSNRRIINFDEPLVFQANANRTGVLQIAIAQVTLKNPSSKGDQEAQDKWSHLLHQGFRLSVRGILKYSLPFSKDQVVRVCYVRRVEGSETRNDDNGDSIPQTLLFLSKKNIGFHDDYYYMMGVCEEREESEN